MWARFRSSKIKKDRKELKGAHKILNVNEEYFSALRTKSYADFFTKVQDFVNEPSTPSFCYHQFSEILLEPGQDKIASILESAILSKNPSLKNLMIEYFDISAEASKICSQLLKKIYQIQINYQFIQQALETIHEYKYSPEQFGLILSELSSFIILNNPFSNPNKHDFMLLHDEYSLVLHRLNIKRKNVARKIKMIKCFKTASGVCITVACSLVAITAMILAAHTLTALLMGPAILSFPFSGLKKKVLCFRFFKSGLLKKVGDQLDVAAKGTYILKRDFDTMSRLVARIHDEVEHNKSMIQLCLKRREEDSFSLLEAIVKELRKSDVGFRKQVEELKEHVYLCLVTINRARALVIREMTTSSCV